MQTLTHPRPFGSPASSREAGHSMQRRTSSDSPWDVFTKLCGMAGDEKENRGSLEIPPNISLLLQLHLCYQLWF